MKALSIHPFYAGMIWKGEKTVEVRTWRTDYRGDVLICSTAKKEHGTIPGHALCVARLVDVRPFTMDLCDAAMMHSYEWQSGLFAWIFDDVRTIRPVPVKGKLSLWNYDGEIEILPEPATDEEDEKMFHEIWEPLFV